MGFSENSNFNNIPSYFSLGSIKDKIGVPDRFHWGLIKFLYMIFSFCNYKFYKILLDLTKYNVRYHVIAIVVKGGVDLDLVPNISLTTRALFNSKPR